MPVDTEPELDNEVEDVDSANELDDKVLDDDDCAAETEEDNADGTPPPSPEASAVRRAILLGSAIAVVLAALVGWLGFRAYQAHEAHDQRALYLQAARQGALNLTTIDWQRADADVRRILDGATGQFYDDFSSRSQPFVDLVKHAQSVTVGTVTEAGLESETAEGAQALVAVTVMTSNAGTPEPDPRAWRMRIFVQKVGDQAKVSNVEFVP